MRFLFDAHLDISWNAVAFDRDQTWSIAKIREHEKHRPGKARTRNTVSLPEMRRANIGICLATVLARSRPTAKPTDEPLRTDIDYINQEAACAVAHGQLAYYHIMESQGHMRMIRDAKTLKAIYDAWQRGDAKAPIGYILSMEGADPIINPQQAEYWWNLGLRTACLSHYGPSAYSMGTGGDGPLTDIAYPLLKEFDRLGMILDLVHTADTAVAQALDNFGGPVFVSHGNARALVPGDRQMSDEQIKAIAKRGGILGVVLDAWMLYPDWAKGKTNNQNVTMETLCDHIDHISQLTGSCRHVAFGSDLDGGYGTEQCPCDLDTIADLHKCDAILTKRGYKSSDIELIFSGNWMRFFSDALP